MTARRPRRPAPTASNATRPTLPLNPTLTLVTAVAIAMLVLLAPGRAAAGDAVDLSLSVSGGLEWLGYQEHLDPNGPDSVLARCTVNGEPATCYIDSDAGVQNLLLDLRGRADFAAGFMVGGAARVQLKKGTDREAWKLSVNENGSPGASTIFQRNDLTYRWYRFDVFGGYRVVPLFRPLAGVRISRAEQLRENFDPAPSGIDEAKEPIESTWVLLGALGESARTGVNWGYRFHVALPLSVKTTNTAIEGAEFTGVGGYAIEGAGTLLVPLSELVRLRFELEGGVMHWDGSDVEQLDGNRLAKWPENDTQIMIATGGVEFTL
jgi:hypothetical protein